MLKSAEPLLARFQFRVWAPPESPVRIEYATGLLREIQMQRANGVLWGLRAPDCVQVVSARRDPDEKRMLDLEPVGIFFARIRGEVFLTESDLAELDRMESPEAIALVVAGATAGFFVRGRDGRMQTVRSHLEITVPAKHRRTHFWAWAALAFIPLGAWVHFPKPPMGLTIRENAGELQIAWSRASIEPHASLEIIDGSVRRSIPVTAALAGATYVRRTGDVQVCLRSGGREKTARFLGDNPERLEIDRTRKQIAGLEIEAQTLREFAQSGRKRGAELDKMIKGLIRPGNPKQNR